MSKIALVILILAASVGVASGGLLDTINAVDETMDSVNKHLYNSPGGDDQPPQDVPPPRGMKQAPRPGMDMGGMATGDDEHFIQDNYYFVGETALGGSAWIYVNVATMETPPSKQSKDQGHFMKVKDGGMLWTKYYWKTRIANSNDLKRGTLVIICEKGGENDVYVAPESREDALQHGWFMAKITDISDMYKGYVTVSGPYKVALNNMRVIVK